jgi:hypothetical protein
MPKAARCRPRSKLSEAADTATHDHPDDRMPAIGIIRLGRLFLRHRRRSSNRPLRREAARCGASTRRTKAGLVVGLQVDEPVSGPDQGMSLIATMIKAACTMSMPANRQTNTANSWCNAARRSASSCRNSDPGSSRKTAPQICHCDGQPAAAAQRRQAGVKVG